MSAHRDINRASLRLFGFKLAAALFIIGGIRWWWTGHIPPVQFGIAAALSIAALVFPPALGPVHRLFTVVALALGKGLTFIGLAIGFYLVITPSAVLYRLFAGDPLNRRIDPNATTYWQSPDEQPTGVEAYRNQF